MQSEENNTQDWIPKSEHYQVHAYVRPRFVQITNVYEPKNEDNNMIPR
jgi:hypothetical protein